MLNKIKEVLVSLYCHKPLLRKEKKKNKEKQAHFILFS